MNKKVYQTACGGVLSIVAFMTIFVFSSAELIAFFEGNQYNESSVIENLDYNNTIEYQVG